MPPSIRVSKSPGSSTWRLGDPIVHAIPEPLPAERVAELAKESAAATMRITELQEDLKAYRAKIKAEMDPLEDKVQELAPVIQNGTQPMNVECQWETDEHTTKVWLRRLDNGQIVKGSERAPTGDELAALRQGVIPMDVPADGPKRGRKSAVNGTPDAAREQAEQLFAKPAAEGSAPATSGELPAFEPDGDSTVRPRPRLVVAGGQGMEATIPEQDSASQGEQPAAESAALEAQDQPGSEIPAEPAPLSSYTLPAPHQDWQLQRFPENMVRFYNGATFVGVAEWDLGAAHWKNIEETDGETIPAQVLQGGIVAMLEQKLPEQKTVLPPADEWLTFGDWRVCATGQMLRFWTGTLEVAVAGVNPEGTALTFFQGPTIEIPDQVIRFSLDAVRKGVLVLSRPTAAAGGIAPGAAHENGMRVHHEDAGAEPVSFTHDREDGVEDEPGEDDHQEEDTGTDEPATESSGDESETSDQGQSAEADAGATSEAGPVEGAAAGDESGADDQSGDSLTELAASALRHVKASGAAGLAAAEIGSKTRNRRPGRTLGILVERGYLQVVGEKANARYTITESGGQRLEAYELAHQPKRAKK